jgi:hypothetical protein
MFTDHGIPETEPVFERVSDLFTFHTPDLSCEIFVEDPRFMWGVIFVIGIQANPADLSA